MFFKERSSPFVLIPLSEIKGEEWLLKTLKTDLNTTYDIHDILINHPGPLISESGIKTKEELFELNKKTKIKTFLIGESLLKNLNNNSIFSVL